MPPSVLTRAGFATALRVLARRDPDLAAVVRRFGAPPFWRRPAGFRSLVHIVLEQQVSLASGRAALARLEAAVVPLTPAQLARADEDVLVRAGLTRQKRRYVREVASAVDGGRLDLGCLRRLPDEAARDALMGVTGIGVWTADVYLLMALRRPDVWPAGDLALARALAEVKGRRAAAPARWRPWRAVAARVLWHHYLSARGRAQ